MYRIKFLIAFVLSCYALAVNADEKQCLSYDDKLTYVFFGNGMFTSPIKAWGHLLRIENRIYNLAQTGYLSLSDDELSRLKFLVAPNKNESAFKQAEQVLRQRAESEEAFANKISSAATFTLDRDLLRQVSTYESILSKGHRAIVFGHSQGSMYANAAYDKVIAKTPAYSQSMSLINFGTPDNRVANGRYVNLTSDWVVQLVKVRYPTTLTPKTTNTDLKGHGVLAYLNGNSSRVEINSAIRHAFNTTEFPGEVTQDAILTVDLRWGDQPDMDLHVFEPDGTHVYYGNARGSTGYLDVDDIDGRGPEYYRSTCEEIEPGQYQVAVNYFDGNGSSRAFLNISAGDKQVNFSRLYTTPTPDEGDINPRKVAIVTVKKEEDEKFSFDIKIL